MSLSGLGLVAIWHDLLPEAKPDFYQWHNREHMPERLGIPGFRRGRRFIADRPDSGSPEYFNLYEADTADILSGPDYLHRLNHPTPWTTRSVASFRNVSRAILRVQYSQGVGQGGIMMTLRFDAPPERAAALQNYLKHRALPVVADAPGIAGAHFGLADDAASRLETTERKARAGATLVPAWVVLLEGASRAHLEAARYMGLDVPALREHGAADEIRCDVFALEHTRGKRP